MSECQLSSAVGKVNSLPEERPSDTNIVEFFLSFFLSSFIVLLLLLLPLSYLSPEASQLTLSQ